MVETPKGHTIIEQREGERERRKVRTDSFGRTPYRRFNVSDRRVSPAITEHAMTMLAEKDARIAEFEREVEELHRERDIWVEATQRSEARLADALAAAKAQPEGGKWMPKEPTEAMVAVGLIAARTSIYTDQALKTYRAMYDAAPAPDKGKP